MDKYYIPQKLDAPFKIAIFTMEELVVFIVPFMIIAFVFQKHLLALAVSITLCVFLKKLKGDENQHFFKHFAYWHFPPLAFYKVIPPSHVREIIG